MPRPRASLAVPFAAALVLASCRSHEPERDPTLRIPARAIHPANQALLDYLGEPGPWPRDVDPSFEAAGMRAAVERACADIGATLRRCEIDDSEFPPVLGVEMVYARETDDADTFGKALPAPYEWRGCNSTGWTEDGRRCTQIAACVVPGEAIDGPAAASAHRRLAVRLDRVLDVLDQEHR